MDSGEGKHTVDVSEILQLRLIFSKTVKCIPGGFFPDFFHQQFM